MIMCVCVCVYAMNVMFMCDVCVCNVCVWLYEKGTINKKRKKGMIRDDSDEELSDDIQY